MTQSQTVGRQCPTRQDGADTLIAHWITENTCSERQHRNYHKCFGCSFGYSEVVNVALAPLPKPKLRAAKVEKADKAAAAV